MKNYMHITNEFGELIKKPIYDGAFLEGITTAKKTDGVNTGFIGYGAAITGSSCYNLSLMKKEERQSLLHHLYSEDGLHMNIARLSVGASDYSAEVYTYDDVENDNLNMASFDRKGRLFTVGCLAEHADGTTQLFLVNPKSEKEQVQYFHNGKCLYIEMLPNTVATVTLD